MCAIYGLAVLICHIHIDRVGLILVTGIRANDLTSRAGGLRDDNLTVLVGVSGGVVVLGIGHFHIQSLGRIGAGQQHRHYGLVVAVQQAARGQQDSKRIRFIVITGQQRHQRTLDGGFFGICDNHGVLAYHGGAAFIGVGAIHRGDCQLAVLIGLALGRTAQIRLNNYGFVRFGSFLVVGHSDSDTVLSVHVLSLRQIHGDVAGAAHADLAALNGPPGLGALHLDSKGMTVAVSVLPAYGSIAIAIGGTGSAGDGNLTGSVGFSGAEIVVAVSDGNAHACHGGLVLHKLNLDGGLVGIVQQAARGQTDGQGLVLMERDRGSGNGIFAIRIGDDHQIAAHNGLALAVRGGLIVDFLDFFRFQGFSAHGTFLVLAALAVRGGLLVDDPVTGLVSGSVGVIALVGVAAAGAGIGGVAHFRAGGGGDFLLIVMAQGIDDHSAALGTELGRGTGGHEHPEP